MLSYEELLTTKAIIALINKIKPLAASNLKNHLNGDDIYFNINYFIKSLKNKTISVIDWYKLFNRLSKFGYISDSCDLKVSAIIIIAIKVIMRTKNIFKIL